MEPGAGPNGNRAPTVATKQAMYRLFGRGAFGNRLRGWPSTAAARSEGFDGLVGVRDTVRSGNPLAGLPNVTLDEMDRLLNGTATGIEITEGAPDDRLLWQGEVCRMPGGLYVQYSDERGLKMREAMRQARRLVGAAAAELLRSTLTPSSYEDLSALLDRYPDSVIEVSVYECPLGNCRQRNAVVWEVRNY